jgi:hypothetical protein
MKTLKVAATEVQDVNTSNLATLKEMLTVSLALKECWATTSIG